MGSVPGSAGFPGGRNGNPLQYPCLENPRDRGAWQATVHGGPKELDITERLTLPVTLHKGPLSPLPRIMPVTQHKGVP